MGGCPLGAGSSPAFVAEKSERCGHSSSDPDPVRLTPRRCRMFERSTSRPSTRVCSWLPVLGLLAGALTNGCGNGIIHGTGQGTNDPAPPLGGTGGTFLPPTPHAISPPGATPPLLGKPRPAQMTPDD